MVPADYQSAPSVARISRDPSNGVIKASGGFLAGEHDVKVRLPRLLTRLDMGYLVDGELKPFVNEVEFVPSLYC